MTKLRADQKDAFEKNKQDLEDGIDSVCTASEVFLWLLRRKRQNAKQSQSGYSDKNDMPLEHEAIHSCFGWAWYVIFWSATANQFSNLFDVQRKWRWRVTGVTISLYTCVMCYCVTTASMYTSAGALSLKHIGVCTLVITWSCTDCSLRTSPTTTQQCEKPKTVNNHPEPHCETINNDLTRCRITLKNL